MTDSAGTASLEANLRLGNGLQEQDRERVLRRLAALDARLRSFRADAVDLLLTVKEHETLRPAPDAGGHHRQLPARRRQVGARRTRRSTAEVSGELARQLTDVKTRREPAHRHHHDPGSSR